MRCLSCAQFGCECPSGYRVAIVVCDVCRHRCVASFAACEWEPLECPRCGGSVTEQADAEQA